MANRRQFISQLTMAAGAVTILRPLQAFAGTSSSSVVHSNTITILHINSLQGQWQALPAGHKLSGLGGLQQVAQQLAEIKRKYPFAFAIHTGKLAGNKSLEGQPFAEALKSAGFDAIIPGRLDKAGKENDFLRTAGNGLPVLTADGQESSSLLPFTTVSKGGFQIGIIDATGIGQRTVRLQAAAVNKTAAALKSRQRCAIVGCVVQPEHRNETPLAALTNGVDILFCANTKTALHNTSIVCNSKGQEVYLSYAGSQGGVISRLDLSLGENNQKAGFASKAIFAGASEKDYAAILKRQLQTAS